jgi:hypothetical protein
MPSVAARSNNQKAASKLVGIAGIMLSPCWVAPF